MQVGDLATWVGAVGTVGALGFTAYTLRRQIDRERRADDERRRTYAKRVRISITEEPLRVAEVINDGDANIYMVGAYVVDKQTREVFANSGRLVDIIAPGTRRDFPLMPVGENAETPSSYFCFVQFTDDNGYRWSRYMMGLLVEVAQENKADQGRDDALDVSLSIVDEPLSVVEVVNNSKHSIYQVSILIKNKADGSLAAVGDTTEKVIGAGFSHRFVIKSAKRGSGLPAIYFCIAQFTDMHGIRWNRYLMGGLERVGPEPSRSRQNMHRKIVRNWLHVVNRLRR